MVKIEETALGAFEEDFFAVFDRLEEEGGSVGDMLAEAVGIAGVVSENLVRAERLELGIERLQHGVFEGDDLSDALLEEFGADKVSDADGVGATGFFLVAGADAAHGGTDGFFLTRLFEDSLFGLMPGHDDMGAVADEEVFLDPDPLPAEGIHFIEEGVGIHDHSGTDDGLDLGAEDPGRDEGELIFHSLTDDGMPGVVASLIADNQVMPIGQKIDNFALGFIAPLQPNH